jgi:hypothetical protein
MGAAVTATATAEEVAGDRLALTFHVKGQVTPRARPSPAAIASAPWITSVGHARLGSTGASDQLIGQPRRK